MDAKKLQGRLERLTKQRDELNKKYEGKESLFTFHAGYDIGYLEGKISVLDDMIDILKEDATSEEAPALIEGIKKEENSQAQDQTESLAGNPIDFSGDDEHISRRL